jgi:phosphoribosylformylglycinamidine synthase
MHGHLGGRPPAVRLDAEQSLAAVLRGAASQGMIRSAHDLSEGGLIQAVVESALVNGVGATISIAGDAFTSLFSESAARAIVTTSDPEAVLGLAGQHGVPATRLGVTGVDAVVVSDLFDIGLEELRAAFEGTLPALFG